MLFWEKGCWQWKSFTSAQQTVLKVSSPATIQENRMIFSVFEVFCRGVQGRAGVVWAFMACLSSPLRAHVSSVLSRLAAILHCFLVTLWGHRVADISLIKTIPFWVWRKHPRKNWFKVPEGKDTGRSVDKRRDSWVKREAPLRSIPLDRMMTDRMWNSPRAWWRIEVLRFLQTKQNQGELRVERSSLVPCARIPYHQFCIMWLYS